MTESVFGIIVERFAVLQKPISLIDFTSVCHTVMACCALHNFLGSKIPGRYTPFECLDDEDFETGNVTPGYCCNKFMDLERKTAVFSYPRYQTYKRVVYGVLQQRGKSSQSR
jgi:hypothetical protein